MLKGAARSAVYFLLSTPLVVIAILVSRQIDYAFNLRKFYSINNTLPLTDLQQIMAGNELSVRSFFLIFFCFLMILCGLLIVLRGTENAFNLSSDAKVRQSLKTAYPGVLLAVAGSLMLAFSVYQALQVQLLTTSQLISLKKQNQIGRNPDLLLEQTQYPPGNVSRAANKQAEEKTPSEIIASSIGGTIETEVKWADQLALKTVVYGYSPTSKELERYQRIADKLSSDSTSAPALNEDLHWAFMFFRRTGTDYRPTAEELKKYEAIVHDYLQKGRSESISPTSLR